MPVALLSSVMPVLFLVLAFFAGENLGGRAVFGLAVMACLIAFVFVQFLREARDLDK